MYYNNYNSLYIYLFIVCITSYGWSQSNIPPTITASGNQYYCPLSQINIVTDSDIIDPDNTEISALFIQISTGYVQGEDTLSLTGVHPNITTSWNITEGKLSLKGPAFGPANYVDIIAAVKDVVFESNSPTPSGDKFFSFTIGNANFLPSTGHYYEYVPDIGITWTDAKVAAESRTFFGLQGYLATITSTEEAQLSGEQAAGAGWIGGRDAAIENEWKWETGPENGLVFWNGLANGSSPNFAFWNTGEPNQLGNEDYAHVTAPNVGITGSWNDLPNAGTSGDYEPKGYIVEYGGMPGDPTVNISASTNISINSISSITEGERCGEGSVTLSASPVFGTVFWFDSETSTTQLGSGLNFTTPIITTTTTYYALASVDGCLTGDRVPVIATIDPVPIITPAILFKNCDEDGVPDGFTNFNLNEANTIITNGASDLTISYHLSLSEADNNTNAIDPSPFNNITANTVYARVENSFGCYQMATVDLEVSTTSFTSSIELSNCDNETADGLQVFDLSQATSDIISQLPLGQNLSVHYYRNLEDAQLEHNEIATQNSYMNEIPFSQTLYVRIENDDNGNCFHIGQNLTLTVNPIPEFEMNSTEMLCLNLAPITLKTFNPSDNYTYQWTDGSGAIISNEASATVSTGGVYTVIATSSLNCTSFRTVTVSESIIADIDLADVTIIDDSENNTILINDQNNNLGIGDYEFALDNGIDSYQDEPLFEMVNPGIHTIFIRDKNNCGIAQLEVFLLGFPKFFTPNNDGFNDRWQIKGLSDEYIDASYIYIYDRFGKIVAKIDPKGDGWDGNYNGKLLPSTDYWFSLEFIDENGKSFNKRGHFSLIRR